MVSKLAFIGGGLLEGVGKGLVLSGKQKREEALKRIEQEGADKRVAGKEKFERLLTEFEQENRLELEGVKQGNRQGLLGERLGREDVRQILSDEAAGERRTEASRSAENVAKITAGSRKAVAEIAAGKPTDTTAAEDRIIKRHVEVDENGIETVNHEAAATELEERGFKKAAAAQRSRAKGIADQDIRQRAEKFADEMVKEQSGTFSLDSSDFKDDGGSRTRFRARMIREFIAKNGGKGAASAVKPAVAGPYVGDTPPPNALDARKSPNDGYWYVKRDGKWQQIQK